MYVDRKIQIGNFISTILTMTHGKSSYVASIDELETKTEFSSSNSTFSLESNFMELTIPLLKTRHS